jgi:hypothetical protein
MDSKKFIIVLLLLLISGNLFCQTEKKRIWLDSIYKDNSFDKLSIEFLKDKDLSEVISNQIRLEGDPMMYYSGVFGANYTRIDFYLTATKQDLFSLDYQITGFDKLGMNIRPITGLMRIKDLFVYKEDYWIHTIYLVVLDCKFYEPGDKNGDGCFDGIYTAVFDIENNKVEEIASESGDFSEYSRVFIGSWQKYNTNNVKSTIFSLSPIGLYGALPMCEEFYQICDDCPDDNVIPKDKYVKNGWINYSATKKEKWW